MELSEFQNKIFWRLRDAMLSNENCDASIIDIFDAAKYLGGCIYDFRGKKQTELKCAIDFPELIAVDVFKFDDDFRNVELDIYFDLGLEKPFVFNVWYENDVEYALNIHTY